MKKEEMKNCLMVYKGGGYDGCFWEYNICMWDSNGVWHDIFSSGCDGLTTEEDALKAFEEHSHSHVAYNIMVRDDINGFRDTYGVNMVFGVMKYFNEHGIPSKLMLKCDRCVHESDDVSDFHLQGLRADGGIHCSNTDIVCNDCISLSSCDQCGIYMSDGEDKERYLISTHDHGKVCASCLDSTIESCRRMLKSNVDRWNQTGQESYLNAAIVCRNDIEKYMKDIEEHDRKVAENYCEDVECDFEEMIYDMLEEKDESAIV